VHNRGFHGQGSDESPHRSRQLQSLETKYPDGSPAEDEEDLEERGFVRDDRGPIKVGGINSFE
jgi:hypothetical protein